VNASESISGTQTTSDIIGPSLWLTAAIYTLCALAGALVGREYYQPTPPSFGQHLVLSDLRHGGAIMGAMLGAMSTALMASRLSKFRSTVLPRTLFALAGGLLVYLLWQPHSALGILTMLSLALPWLIAYLFIAFDRRKSGQQQSAPSRFAQ
jgi:hypothetical protein